MHVYIIYIIIYRGISSSSTRGNAKSCIWGEVASAISRGWGLTKWKATLQGKTWGSLATS